MAEPFAGNRLGLPIACARIVPAANAQMAATIKIGFIALPPAVQRTIRGQRRKPAAGSYPRIRPVNRGGVIHGRSAI